VASDPLPRIPVLTPEAFTTKRKICTYSCGSGSIAGQT
jgi:hypothetical protein